MLNKWHLAPTLLLVWHPSYQIFILTRWIIQLIPTLIQSFKALCNRPNQTLRLAFICTALPVHSPAETLVLAGVPLTLKPGQSFDYATLDSGSTLDEAQQ